MAGRIGEILQEPLRHPAAYPIQVGFETFFLWNASRCALFEEPTSPNTYSLVLSNLSVTHPVFCNNDISKQDSRGHITVYLITELCNIVYTIGKFCPTKSIPYRYGPYLSTGILCEYAMRLTIEIPEYILPAGCYLFIISRNADRPAKCYRSPLPTNIYKPYNFKPGVPITYPVSSDLSSLSELGRELLGDPPQDDTPIIEAKAKRLLSDKHTTYYQTVFSLIYSIFYTPKSDTFGGPSAEDILKTKPGIGDWLNRDTITSSDNSSVFIENKHFSLPSGPHIHPAMAHFPEVKWRPFVILVSEQNLKKKFEKFTGEILSVRSLVSMLMGGIYTKDERLNNVQTFTLDSPGILDFIPLDDTLPDDVREDDIFIPSPIACIIFSKVERIVVDLDYVYRIRAYRRVTRFEGKVCPLRLLMAGLQNMLK